MEADEYRKMAAVEDRMWYYAALHARMIGALRAGAASGPLLDAGCGTGGLLRRLAETPWGREAIGVDLSPLACALSRERTTARIVEASLTDLPLADGKFGAVVSADVLYHVPDDTGALREIARVLRPGGLAVINVPAYPWLWSYHDVSVHSQRRYGRAELRAKLTAAGLGPLQVTHWNAFLLPLVVLRRKLLPAPTSGSDVEDYSPWLNATLEAILKAEGAVMRACGGLPFGSSLLAVARKET